METSYLKREGKPDLAYVKIDAHENQSTRPVIVFLGGFRSDMLGTKAIALQEYCLSEGLGYLRLDYSGHGQSKGDFNDGTIGIWASDARDVIQAVCPNQDVILVGSSMGGWIGLLLAMQYKAHVKGLVGIAAAPDFSIYMYDALSDDQKHSIQTQGFVELPNDYSDEPYRISKALIDDGARNAILDNGIDIDIPVHLIQGKQDEDVQWRHALRIKEAINGTEASVTFVEDGDHRLSRPQDLQLLNDTVHAVLNTI